MKEFSIRTSVFFGENALDKLSDIVDQNVFIVCDSFMKSSGMADKIKEKLVNCNVTVFSDVVPDPPVEVIAAGMEELQNSHAQIMIALGGGSSIDAAKAIREFSEQLPNVDNNIKEFIAIPTTSGTGSEVTQFSVITNKQEGLKYALSKESLLPSIAILDPSLVSTVPQKITADTGMDVLTHAIEAYVSTNATDFSDALAEKAVSLVFEYLPRAYANGNDLEAREKMHNASCLAGMAFNSVGLGITHSIAHAVGGKLHISHGRSNAMLLPLVVEYNANISSGGFVKEYPEAAKKLQHLAKIVGLHATAVPIGVGNLVHEIVKLNRYLKIPATLKELGTDLSVAQGYQQDIVDAAMKDICTKTNPRVASPSDIKYIFTKLLG